MQILGLIFVVITLSAAQFPSRYRRQGFRNIRPPLATSASNETPYLSIPIVLMPNGQVVPKPAQLSYRYVPSSQPHVLKNIQTPATGDLSGHYQIVIPPPTLNQVNTHRHAGKSEVNTGSITSNTNEQRSNGMQPLLQNNIQSIYHQQNVNTLHNHEQRQRNTINHQHATPTLHPANKHHVTNFLNFATEIGQNVLPQQVGRQIIISTSKSPLTEDSYKSTNQGNYIIQGTPVTQISGNAHISQTLGQQQTVQISPVSQLNNYNAQYIQGSEVHAQTNNPQQYVQTHVKHPFQGVQTQGGVHSTHNTATDGSQSQVQNSNMKTISYTVPSQSIQYNSNSDTPSKESLVQYNPQLKAFTIIPQSGSTIYTTSNTQIMQPNYHSQQTIQHASTSQNVQQNLGPSGKNNAFISYQTPQVLSGHHFSNNNNAQMNHNLNNNPPENHANDYTYSIASNAPTNSQQVQVAHRVYLSNDGVHKQVPENTPQTHYSQVNEQPTFISTAGQTQTSHVSGIQNNKNPHDSQYAYIVQNAQTNSDSSTNQESITAAMENGKVIYASSSAKQISYNPSGQTYSPQYPKNMNHPTSSYDTYNPSSSFYREQSSSKYNTGSSGSTTMESTYVQNTQSNDKLSGELGESDKEDDEEEEKASYKVVYLPLNVLKNILSNSVDNQKHDKLS